MSVQAVKWVRDLRGINVGQKSVLFVLAEHKNDKSGKCCPSISTIAAEAGCCTKTVKRNLKALADKKLLAIESRNGFRGRTTSNQYVLNSTPAPRTNYPPEKTKCPPLI